MNRAISPSASSRSTSPMTSRSSIGADAASKKSERSELATRSARRPSGRRPARSEGNAVSRVRCPITSGTTGGSRQGARETGTGSRVSARAYAHRADRLFMDRPPQLSWRVVRPHGNRERCLEAAGRRQRHAVERDEVLRADDDDGVERAVAQEPIRMRGDGAGLHQARVRRDDREQIGIGRRRLATSAVGRGERARAARRSGGEGSVGYHVPGDR